MRKLILLPIFIFSTVLAMAQTVDDVTLVVSGDGATKEAATHVALRSAIEQAYGVFVSANTEILNDELVKDEIATVASGNVKSYTELSATVLPNGNHLVSLQATVSTKSLATYAQSKGASCEFAGATFGANLKLVELNQKNTKIALDNLLQQCSIIAEGLYDTELTIGDPTAHGELELGINYYSNQTTCEFIKLITNTLQALSLSPEEIQNLQKLQIPSYPYSVIFASTYDRSVTNYTLYSRFPGFELEKILNKSIVNPWYVETNLENLRFSTFDFKFANKALIHSSNDGLSCSQNIFHKPTKKNPSTYSRVLLGRRIRHLTIPVDSLTKITNFYLKRINPEPIVLDISSDEVQKYELEYYNTAKKKVMTIPVLESHLSYKGQFGYNCDSLIINIQIPACMNIDSTTQFSYTGYDAYQIDKWAQGLQTIGNNFGETYQSADYKWRILSPAKKGDIAQVQIILNCKKIVEDFLREDFLSSSADWDFKKKYFKEKDFYIDIREPINKILLKEGYLKSGNLYHPNATYNQLKFGVGFYGSIYEFSASQSLTIEMRFNPQIDRVILLKY